MKKISILKKEEDFNANKFLAKTVLKQISQVKLFAEANQKPLEKEKVNEKLYSEEELDYEKVTRVEPSVDKKEIFVGTSLGRISVISSETFKV